MADLHPGIERGRKGGIGYLHRHGKGRSLVLVHGLGAHSGSWMPLIEKLPDEFNIYAIDLLGHGESAAPEAFSVEVQEAALEGFISAAGLSEFYLFGHSYGAWLAVLYAIRHPGLSGLIIEDASGLKEYFNDLGLLNRKEYISAIVNNISGRDGISPGIVSGFMDRMFYDKHISREALGGIRCPALVLWGSDDSRIPVKYGRLFNEHIKGSTFKEIKGAKHTPHYTHAAEVADAVSRFAGLLD